MLRRSSSCSNIPIRGNLRRSRSASQSRVSGVDTLKVPNNANKYSTPLQRQSSMSSRNSKYSTPSQGPSNCQLKSPSSTGKPKSFINQKKLNDKRWLSEQYAKVQNYLQDDLSCDQDLVANIKPPSLQSFIYISSLLFSKIFVKIVITTANYKEVIPTCLKLLKYPGTLSNSTLKIANTMHAWPSIIAMFSWLISLIETTNATDGPPTFKDEECDKKVQLSMASIEYLRAKFEAFNDNKTEDTTLDIEYKKILENIFQIDDKAIDALALETAELNGKRDKLKQQLLQNEERNNVYISDINKMKHEIEQYNEDVELEEENLKYEILKLTQTNNQSKNKIESIKQNIIHLKEAISKQSCSETGKKQMLRDIDTLKQTVQLKKEKIEMLKNIRDEQDYKLTELTRKINFAIHHWNNSLLKMSLEFPELKSLFLTENTIHQQTFKNEIEAVIKKKLLIEEKYCGKGLDNIQSEIALKQKEKEELEREIVLITQRISNLQSINNNILEKIDQKVCSIQKIKDAQERETKLHCTKLENLMKDNDLSEKQTELIKLQKAKEDALADYNKFAKDSVHFFVEVRKQVISNVKEMEQIRKDIHDALVNALKTTVDEETALIDMFDNN